MESMYTKIHESGKNVLIAICDKEIIGRKLKYKDREIEISESFYKGEEKTSEEIFEMLKFVTMANIIGEKSVNCAIDAGFVDPESVIYLDGVPHAIYFLI